MWYTRSESCLLLHLRCHHPLVERDSPKRSRNTWNVALMAKWRFWDGNFACPGERFATGNEVFSSHSSNLFFSAATRSMRHLLTSSLLATQQVLITFKWPCPQQSRYREK